MPFFVFAQDSSKLEKGVNLTETKTYTAKEDTKILKLYEGLRVADVSDGMDFVGLPGSGLVDPAIHPDGVDLKDLSHQFRSIAITARYVPTQKPDRPRPGEDFKKWEGHCFPACSKNRYRNGWISLKHLRRKMERMVSR